MSSVATVLEQLRAASTSEADKGSRFERLIREALRTDRTYRERFSDVWLWSDWPDRGNVPDIGIDLVAKHAHDAGYTAIQVKFYAPGHRLMKEDIDSFFTASGRHPFTDRIIVATSDQWSVNAEKSLSGQDKPVTRIGIDELDAMTIEWEGFDPDRPANLIEAPRHELRAHQEVAVQKVLDGLAEADRGQLVMACGTGKTFTSLRIAESLVGPGGTMLFLAPSIALVSQTLKEWTAQASFPIRPFAVCSDTSVGRTTDGEIATPYDLAIPPTTDAATLAAAGVAEVNTAMTVVFATYQSSQVVADMQARTGLTFDLVVSDEAHRTAGRSGKDEDDSAFLLVHDDAVIPAAKRLYMTATPKVYKPAAKIDANEADVVVASMDDPAVFGPELHRLTFGEAVTRGLLADYRVLILTVAEDAISESFQELLSSDGDLNLPEIAKIVGCLAGLSKRRAARRDRPLGVDEEPMRRAVAFWSTIADSQRFAATFERVAEHYQTAGPGATARPLAVPTRHVDGSTDVRSRRVDIRWLEAEPADDECRVLTNAKCLTEGVNVPALDAVMFLQPKRSHIDIVQAVGRVMRKPPGKEMGYIILPVVVPAGQSPEQALESNPDYDIVWEVLQALRSHDERFNAYVNRITYLSDSPAEDPDGPIEIVDVSADLTADDIGDQGPVEERLPGMLGFQEWTGAIYTRIVEKVGTRTYWEQWAADVVHIARRHHQRILDILAARPDAATAFDAFLEGLRNNLNDGITTDDAIAMVSQHLITRPIFEALFGDDAFVLTNPVAQAMQHIADVLDEHNLDTETASLDDFYASVRMRIDGIPTSDGTARQRIIKDLYGRFFKVAFPADAASLGIVYTPIEVVDFILRAAEAALREHFDGASLSDDGVHVLDPFTGTGTFITRLLQGGFIRPEDLARKFAEEIHANEILLLAYYIAAVNIEVTYRQVAAIDQQQAFPGIVLTDTFQMGEGTAGGTLDVFPINNERAERQKGLAIRVIVGNPPYSAGQTSANDNNANVAYPALDESIRQTYAKRSTATRKGSLYDSYVRAIRWASRRIIDAPEGGVVAYVTNGGFIDSNTADGIRLTLAEEFHHVYVYNLRGNQRTAGELSRREGGKIFGAGSRNTVAITLLVRLAHPVPAGGGEIHYRDIGEYLSRAEKLKIIDSGLRPNDFGPPGLDTVGWRSIEPNVDGDWINQRSPVFATLLPLHADDEPSVFGLRTNGLKTNRDAWNYNSSRQRLEANTRGMIEHYNAQVAVFHDAYPTPRGTQKERAEVAKKVVDLDPKAFSWDRADFNRLVQGETYDAADALIMPAYYRPFTSRYGNAAGRHNNSVYKLPRVFPDPDSGNLAIGTLDPGGSAPFTALMVDRLPDDKLVGAGNAMQFLGRWIYKEPGNRDAGTLALNVDSDEWRVDNITEHALDRFRAVVPDFTPDDVFYTVYAILHAEDYREAFAADLKRSLPRIPVPDDPEVLRALAAAGRDLANLHLHFDRADVWPDLEIRTHESFDQENPAHLRVSKMRYAKRPNPEDPRGRRIDDPTTIVFNDLVTIANIPERAHEYRLGSRSALDWVVEQQQVKTDKKSGITNDPNNWATEHGEPRYILDLVGRVVTVSMRTLDVIDGLPSLAPAMDSQGTDS